LEKSLRDKSLPFFSTLVRWTTFARLDLGIVVSLEGVRGGVRGFLGFEKFISDIGDKLLRVCASGRLQRLCLEAQLQVHLLIVICLKML